MAFVTIKNPFGLVLAFLEGNSDLISSGIEVEIEWKEIVPKG